jgi:hypothetical protein
MVDVAFSAPPGLESRDEIGSVEIVSPGTFTVTAGPELPDAVEPQILLGS